MNFVFVVFTNHFPGYWGKGTTLDEAISNFKKAGGKWIMKEVAALMVLGDKPDFDAIYLDEMMTFHYPKDTTSHRILG